MQFSLGGLPYDLYQEEIYERVCLYLLQKFSISLINHVWELGALNREFDEA